MRGPDDVVVGPLIELDDLRKKVSGIVSGFMPASVTCEA